MAPAPMSRSCRAVVVILIMTLTNTVSQAQAQASRIDLRQIEQMFNGIRTQTKWNIDGPMLWGYFFLDPSAEKLRSAAAELQDKGYRLVSVQAVQGRAIYRLHVERVETHSPSSLHARNNELYALANKHLLASYDGMDVGPAPSR